MLKTASRRASGFAGGAPAQQLVDRAGQKLAQPHGWSAMTAIFNSLLGAAQNGEGVVKSL
jgi:hypothetical protein